MKFGGRAALPFATRHTRCPPQQATGTLVRLGTPNNRKVSGQTADEFGLPTRIGLIEQVAQMGPNRVDRYGHAFADLMQVEAFEQQDGKLRLSFRQTIELCEQ